MTSLAETCRGLVLISEIDAGLVVFSGPKGAVLTAADVLKIVGKDVSTPIEERSPEEFFQRLTAVKDWHSNAQKEMAKTFQKLFWLLKKDLRHLKVFRIGVVRIDIYILGLDRDGYVAGIRTTVVET